MPNLYFTSSIRLTTYLTRYHLNKGRIVTVTMIPEYPVHPGMVPVSRSFNSVYQLTIYAGIITGKVRRTIRILEMNRELYYSLMSSTGAKYGFYFDRLDRLVGAWTARGRKLRALAEVAIDADFRLK